MPIKKLLALFGILALVTLACGFTVDLGNSASSTPTQITSMDQVSTMVAQTMQALTQEALLSTPASTPTPAGSATLINSPLPPTLSVGVATNCYAGPNTNYGFVITIRPGTTVTVVGKDTADNYWIIDVPGYPGTVCWLSGQYASVSGDTNYLPAPATPQPPIYYTSNINVNCYRLAPWPRYGGSRTHWPRHGGGGWSRYEYGCG